MFSGVASLRTAYSKPVNPLGYVEVKRLHSNPAAALSDPNTCATNSYRSRCVESRQFRRSNDLSSYGFHRNYPQIWFGQHKEVFDEFTSLPGLWWVALRVDIWLAKMLCILVRCFRSYSRLVPRSPQHSPARRLKWGISLAGSVSEQAIMY